MPDCSTVPPRTRKRYSQPLPPLLEEGGFQGGSLHSVVARPLGIFYAFIVGCLSVGLSLSFSLPLAHSRNWPLRPFVWSRSFASDPPPFVISLPRSRSFVRPFATIPQSVRVPRGEGIAPIACYAKRRVPRTHTYLARPGVLFPEAVVSFLLLDEVGEHRDLKSTDKEHCGAKGGFACPIRSSDTSGTLLPPPPASSSTTSRLLQQHDTSILRPLPSSSSSVFVLSFESFVTPRSLRKLIRSLTRIKSVSHSFFVRRRRLIPPPLRPRPILAR